jgi:Uncharacterised protein family UPF0547
MDSSAIFSVLFGLGILALVIWLFSRPTQLQRHLKKTPDPKSIVNVGRYVTGLPGLASARKELTCLIAGGELSFLVDEPFSIAGTISVDQIDRVYVEDKSQIVQRLTATRLLLIGPFAFAAPKAKKRSEFCLVIESQDNGDQESVAVFEFAGANAQTRANTAANAIAAALQSRSPKSRKCPECAETIKADARVCRFCGVTVRPVESSSLTIK